MSTVAQLSGRALAVALVIALGFPVVLAGRGSSSRPGGGSGGNAGTTTATRGGGGGSAGGSSIQASGRATWRYGGAYHGGGYYPGWGWGWPYAPYWGWSGGWYGVYGPAWYGPPRTTLVFAGDLAHLPGAIETRVKPKGARVILDGQDVGRAKDYNGSWDELQVSPGRHTVEFKRDGYQTLRVDLDVRGGQAYRIDRTLRKGDGTDPETIILEPPRAASRYEVAVEPVAYLDPPSTPSSLRRGLLQIEVEPADAAVDLDGEYLARADELARLHGALPVAAGAHRIEVVRPGHEGQEVVVEIEEGETGLVEIRLERR